VHPDHVSNRDGRTLHILRAERAVEDLALDLRAFHGPDFLLIRITNQHSAGISLDAHNHAHSEAAAAIQILSKISREGFLQKSLRKSQKEFGPAPKGRTNNQDQMDWSQTDNFSFPSDSIVAQAAKISMAISPECLSLMFFR
jgi:hypothetical protein